MKRVLATVSCVVLVCAAGVVRAAVTGSTGSSAPIDNQQPSLVMNDIICVAGADDDLGTVEPFVGNFVPGGYMLAQGQILSIASNQALYNAIGDAYGGDGVTTFALPNLQGRAFVGAGGDLGTQGTVSGSNSIALTDATMPTHTHTLPGGGTTAPEGDGGSFSNAQESLAMNFQFATVGIFPSQGAVLSATAAATPDATAASPQLGTIRISAATNMPSGFTSASGQSLLVSQNTALSFLIGTTYGGDGQTAFNLPNLNGATPISSGQGPGTASHALGETGGSNNTTLTVAQLPAHTHTLPNGQVTGSTGGNAPVDNDQSYTTLNYIICLFGVLPTTDGTVVPDEPYIGEVQLFAGNFAPEGYAFADGQLLQIQQDSALYQIIGTTYGGDGQTTFALPDLRGRTIVGAGVGSDGNSYVAGESLGTDQYSISIDQMADHDHDYAVPEPATTATIAAVAITLSGRRRYPAGPSSQ